MLILKFDASCRKIEAPQTISLAPGASIGENTVCVFWGILNLIYHHIVTLFVLFSPPNDLLCLTSPNVHDVQQNGLSYKHSHPFQEHMEYFYNDVHMRAFQVQTQDL